MSWKRAALVIPAAALLFAATACGGGGTPTTPTASSVPATSTPAPVKTTSGNPQHVLHFTGSSETEGNFRARARVLLLMDMVSAATCPRIEGLSAEAALPLLRADMSDPEVPSGATPAPGQKANESDLVRAAAIVIEECARVKS